MSEGESKCAVANGHGSFAAWGAEGSVGDSQLCLKRGRRCSTIISIHGFKRNY